MNTRKCRALIAVLSPLLLAECGGRAAEDANPETAASESGGSSPSGTQNGSSSAPTASNPPAAMASLKVLFSSPMRNGLASAFAGRLQSALVASGYNLVTDEAAPHDLTARLVVTAVRKQSMFNVTVNGRQRVTLQVHAVLTIAGTSGIVDEVSNDFESAGGPFSDGNVTPLVLRMNGSQRLSDYATQQATARDAAAQTAAVQAKSDWDTTVGDCRAPKDVHSCDSLRAWLSNSSPQLPSPRTLRGRPQRPQADVKPETEEHKQHAAEARQILDAAAPALKDFVDDDAWAHADLPHCTTATPDADCMGVTSYLHQFPAGKHAAEATQAIADVTKQANAKAAEEQRRTDAQNQANARQAQQQACKGGCSSKCLAYTAADTNAKCIADCVQGCPQ